MFPKIFSTLLLHLCEITHQFNLEKHAGFLHWVSTGAHQINFPIPITLEH